MIERRIGGNPGMRRTAGFTLIELVMTIVILAVMLALAAPSFISFQRNSQLTSSANAFMAAAYNARSEAMKRQLNTLVQANVGGWASGWTVFVDGDWDFLNQTPSVDVQIGAQGPLPAGIAVPQDTSPTYSSAHDIAFNGAGYLIDPNTNSPMTSAYVQFQNSASSESRYVVLNASGRIRVCNPATDTTCTSAF